MRPPACLPLRPALALLLGLLFVSSAHAGTYAWRTTDSGGNTTALSPTFSGGQWYNGYGDPTVPIPYRWGDYGSGGSTETGSSSGQVNSTGTVTVIFTWQPGYAGEPAPPALITQTCDARWYCNAPAPPAASCSNGLGDPEINPSSGQSYQGESRGTHYSVVFPDANGTVTVTLTGAQAHVPLSSSGSYGSNVWYGIDAYPIVISSPDPLGRPDLGDGKNQFVYSADTPDGYLYVPGALQAVGAGSAEANWLIGNSPIVGPLDKVNLTIDSSIIPNTFTHQWAVSGGTIYVNTPQDVNNPYPGYQFNHWIFKGLPTSFNTAADGNHTVNLLVQGAKTQTAKIQTFYQASANNYPGALDDEQMNNFYTPNWFHYFSLAYPGTTSYDAEMRTLDFVAHPNFAGLAQAQGIWDTSVTPNKLTIRESIQKMGPDALTVASTRGIPVFEISPYTTYLEYLGQMHVKGIYNYIYVDAHEAEHNALVLSGDCYIPDPNSIPPVPPTDTDGDWLTDSAEAKYHTNPKKADTTGYYTDANRFPEATGTYSDGDTEAVCDIAGLHAVLSNNNAWQQDWSDAGVQYGSRGQYFPYMYTPANTNLPPSVSPPSAAVTNLP